MNVPALIGIREFGETDLPAPVVGPGDVLVRVRAVSVCGSDLTAYVGGHTKTTLPTVLGHEFAGVVESVGSDVTTVTPGTRASIDPTYGCGDCESCRSGRKNICRDYNVMGRNLRLPGAMAGLIRVPAAHVHPIPDEMPFEQAAIVQPLSVAYHAAIHRGRVAAGETALIMGAGAIGLGVLMASKAAGANVIVSDVLPDRLATALEMGADAVIDVRTTALVDGVLAATSGRGVDLAYEAVGGRDESILLDAVRAVIPGGRVVVIGLKMQEARIPVSELKFQEKVVLGSQAHPDTFPEVIASLASGRIAGAKLITHRFPLGEVAAAFELIERRANGVIKVVLEV